MYTEVLTTNSFLPIKFILNCLIVYKYNIILNIIISLQRGNFHNNLIQVQEYFKITKSVINVPSLLTPLFTWFNIFISLHIKLTKFLRFTEKNTLIICLAIHLKIFKAHFKNEFPVQICTPLL